MVTTIAFIIYTAISIAWSHETLPWMPFHDGDFRMDYGIFDGLSCNDSGDVGYRALS